MNTIFMSCLKNKYIIFLKIDKKIYLVVLLREQALKIYVCLNRLLKTTKLIVYHIGLNINRPLNYLSRKSRVKFQKHLKTKDRASITR